MSIGATTIYEAEWRAGEIGIVLEIDFVDGCVRRRRMDVDRDVEGCRALEDWKESRIVDEAPVSQAHDHRALEPVLDAALEFGSGGLGITCRQCAEAGEASRMFCDRRREAIVDTLCQRDGFRARQVLR